MSTAAEYGAAGGGEDARGVRGPDHAARARRPRREARRNQTSGHTRGILVTVGSADEIKSLSSHRAQELLARLQWACLGRFAPAVAT
jgi:hypothetical protein